MDDDVSVDFGEDGLVPAVAQDADSGKVLMLAYVSPEALERTRETGRAHYYSRSREELWEKGRRAATSRTSRRSGSTATPTPSSIWSTRRVARATPATDPAFTER